MFSVSKTKLKRDILIILTSVALAALVIVGFVLVLRMEPKIIDKNEVAGEPENSSSISGYVAYETADVCKVKICCEPTLDGKYANIYLTSPSDNKVLIRAEFYSVKVVYNEQTGQASFLPDKLLGKTGFIHPGTYVKQVKIKGVESGKDTKVMVKISTMSEEDGTSKGIFYIRTTIK